MRNRVLKRVPVWLMLLLAIGSFVSPASAQDFKVITTVSQQSPDEARWTQVGSSITLFHAGKVYDYMQQIGEVVICDPAEGQFVILSTRGNNRATTLHFEQLQQFLKVARSQTQAHLKQLTADSKASTRRQQALTFQLDPEFEETFDTGDKTVTFDSPLMSYEVNVENIDRLQVVRQYLEYADLAAKINYILHSGSLYPAPRLEVNRALAEREVIPTQVLLRLDGEVPVHLKANHKFEWTLGRFDKATIRQCETMRTADSTRWVDFRRYQRTVATETAQR